MARRRRLDEADAGLILVTVFIALSMLLPFSLFLLHLGAAACGDSCDTETSWSAVAAFTVFDGILFVAVMVPFALSAKRWKRSWPIPAAGLAVLLVGAVISYVVIRIAIPTL